MAELPLRTGAPTSEEEREARRSNWMSFFQRLRDDPEINAMVFNIGAQLAQPIPVGQSPAGHIGTALASGQQAATETAGRAVAQRNAEAELQEKQLSREQDLTVNRMREEGADRRTGAQIRSAESIAQTRERGATERHIASEATASTRARLAREAAAQQHEEEMVARLERELNDRRRHEQVLSRMDDAEVRGMHRDELNAEQNRLIADERLLVLQAQVEQAGDRLDIDAAKEAIAAATDITGNVDARKMAAVYQAIRGKPLAGFAAKEKGEEQPSTLEERGVPLSAAIEAAKRRAAELRTPEEEVIRGISLLYPTVGEDVIRRMYGATPARRREESTTPRTLDAALRAEEEREMERSRRAEQGAIRSNLRTRAGAGFGSLQSDFLDAQRRDDKQVMERLLVEIDELLGEPSVTDPERRKLTKIAVSIRNWLGLE